jgi:hypothetical protein
MEPSYQAFGEKFSAAVIAKDYTSAHALLAPWLKNKVTPEKLREEIERHVLEMCKVWDVTSDRYGIVRAGNHPDLNRTGFSLHCGTRTF